MTTLGKGVFLYSIVLVGLVLAVGRQTPQDVADPTTSQPPWARETPGRDSPRQPPATESALPSVERQPTRQEPASLEPIPLPLQQAIRDGSVEASIRGLGGSTGDTILIVIRRKMPKTLRIVLTPGTVFRSTSGNIQNMLAASIRGEHAGTWSYRPTADILLEDDAEHSYVVEAYCMDFHKDNPTSSSKFTLAAPNEAARRIVQAGKESLASSRSIQAALWMVRDRVTPSELEKRFPVSDKEMDAAWRILREGPRDAN